MGAALWLILMVILIAIEVATFGLTTIWFAFGALVAFIASLFGASITLQVVLFLIVSIVLLLLTRPMAVRFLDKGLVKTNADSLLGKHAIVEEDISNIQETGLVKVNGLEWMARTKEEQDVIKKGSIVSIVCIEGAKLIVKEKGEES